MSRHIAAWLLWFADRVESIGYWFDDRAWARPRLGEVREATLDTKPLAERLGRPPAPLPMDEPEDEHRKILNEITGPARMEYALELIKTDPEAYFRATHRPPPFGYAA